MTSTSQFDGRNFPGVDIWIKAKDPAIRHREPVTCGIPWPKGMLHEPYSLVLRDQNANEIPVQARTLDRWPDGSVRWVLLDWQATVNGDARLRLEISDYLPAMPTAGSLRVQRENVTIKGRTFHKLTHIRTGMGVCHINNGFLITFDTTPDSGPGRSYSIELRLRVEFDRKTLIGNELRPLVNQIQAKENGLIRSSVLVAGQLIGGYFKHLPVFQAQVVFFSRSPCVRIFFTICNPKRAKHTGGIWCLGDKGSAFVRDASFTIEIPDARLEQLERDKKTAIAEKDFEKAAHLRDQADKYRKQKTEWTDSEWAAGGIIHFSAEIQEPFTQSKGPFKLFQNSSGGSNWQSSNHINRHGVVANALCGYRLRKGDMLSPLATTVEHPQDQSRGESMAPRQEPDNEPGEVEKGQRATPIVTLERDGQTIGLAMRYFWQNFPKWIEAGPQSLTLRLLPRQYAVHELQGGEQKTHEFVLAFGKDHVTPEEPLAWVRSPIRVRVDPAWYAASGAVPYLTPEAEDPNADYIRLVRAAIEGEDTFEKKREVIDEYGWRNFGDIYADHEAVFHKGTQPLVSHYNNQYDPLAGFAIQFMRSGDWRWWDAMNELAAHVVDIDIYHTDQDKAAYNHGLFWHTVHYTDAGLSTHRSYPRAPGIRGGGPGNEHNYTTGLMLHYFLSGNPQSREAAIGLAQWVIDMDDGSKTIFRWLDLGYTGLASATVSPSYHGPGRGAGNSINALLDGHRLTGDQKFLDKAEQLIRRCIHPADDIAARNLPDAEKRWSYTIFLQTLGKYLDYKVERDELDWMYAYGRAALLHYARWMAEHEFPFLEKPEILEYPTETWVAQDMRKSEVFKFAAKHATGDERARFLERSEYFFRYVTTTLMAMKTRTLARPVVILLSNGFMHAYFQKHPDVAAPPPRVNPPDFGKPELFVPQKVRAKRRLAILTGVMAVVALSIFLWWILGK